MITLDIIITLFVFSLSGTDRTQDKSVGCFGGMTGNNVKEERFPFSCAFTQTAPVSRNRKGRLFLRSAE